MAADMAMYRNRAMRKLLQLLAPAVLGVSLSSHAVADGIPTCKDGPSKTLPSRQDSEYDHYRNAKVKAVAGPAGNREFLNQEHRLPTASDNDIYYEYGLGKDGFDGAGAHRAVLLVSQARNKRKVLASYYTRDHYASFCQFNG